MLQCTCDPCDLNAGVVDDGQVPCTTKQRTVAKRICISDDESESESDDDYGRKTARVYSCLPSVDR